MKKYKIIWKANIYGEQIVNADSEEEAEDKAYTDNTGFKLIGDPDFPEWVIEEIKKVSNKKEK